MKKLFIFLTVFMCIPGVRAAEPSLAQLTADGRKVYVEFVDVHNNIGDKEKPIVEALQGTEWNRWILVPEKTDADFILHIHMEKKGGGFTSFGARMFMTPSILTPDGRELWRGSLQKGRATEFTGFNAQNDAARKLVRRSLGEELQQAICSENGTNK